MNILILGTGGREHALAWKLSSSPIVEKVYLAPGNDGVALTPQIELVASLEVENKDDVVHFCKEKNIALAVIGPENLICQGLGDTLRNNQISTLAPSQLASQLESSKVFAKEMMLKADIPTAFSHTVSNIKQAKEFLSNDPWHGQYVIKMDELAQGKGVIVCQSSQEAITACNKFFCDADFPLKSENLLIEKRLKGQEVSVFYLCDGSDFLYLGHACDFKRLNEGNKGPNTGGMGAYSPASWFTEELKEKIDQRVARPLMNKMKEEGIAYQGILFVGVMVDHNLDPFVLEFNVRWGDPETQTLLPLIDEDLVVWFKRAANGNLLLDNHSPTLKIKDKTSVHVVMASKGYPGTEGSQVITGDPVPIQKISPLEELGEQEIYFFSAALKKESDHTFSTHGGRVLGLTALGKDVTQARGSVYRSIEKLTFKGCQYRKDIGP